MPRGKRTRIVLRMCGGIRVAARGGRHCGWWRAAGVGGSGGRVGGSAGVAGEMAGLAVS